jgi:riboflavin synthase alpha subunit
MFTGLISAVAKVVDTTNGRIGIDHAWIAKHLKRGGSVAVNGACLTLL